MRMYNVHLRTRDVRTFMRHSLSLPAALADTTCCASMQVLRDQVALLSAAAPNLEWLGYLSSTGVYGDWGGDWVDEE